MVSLLPMTVGTCLLLLTLMILKKVSSYYYYKTNFLIWAILWFCLTIALLYFDEKIKAFAVTIVLCGVFLSTMFLMRTENHLYNWGIQVTPETYTESETWFRNYSFSRLIQMVREPYSEDKVKIYQEAISYVEKSENTACFLGYWLDNYWFQAITNARNNPNVSLADSNSVDEILKYLQALPRNTPILFMNDIESYFGSDEEAKERYRKIEQYLNEYGQLLYQNEAGKIYECLNEN